LNDAAAPALMLAYAIGRIGCQVSGDGDWGIYNSAFAADKNANITIAAPGQFEQTIQVDSIKTFFLNEYPAGLDKIPHKSFAPKSLSFLPNWMLAYDYPHNVNGAGVKLAGCTDTKYCEHLPVPVFPTSFYETVICLLLLLVLWALRKKLRIPGTLFAVYLMLNGIERFFIEKIRVNNRMNFLGLHPTQAEVISSLLFLSGLIIFIVLRRRATVPKS